MLIQQLNIKVQTDLKKSASWREVGLLGDKIKKKISLPKCNIHFQKHFYCVGKFCNFLKWDDQIKLTIKIEKLETLKLEQIFQMQSTLNAYHGK